MKQTLSILFIIYWIQFVYSNDRLVSTLQGSVRGYKNPENGLYEFYGIPYATVPTGKDKFKAPLPVTLREEILEANDESIYCPQSANNRPGPYKEDCLVLNIFVPDTNLTQYSVVVYIHGGSFEAGWSSLRVPKTIAQNNVIGVSINYRLGAHGFLCLQTETVPGNAGLKDQLAALRWVKENIASFGGNTEDITLAGYSAGAATVEMLMLSPTTKDLFHKVILESGYGIASFAIKEKPVEFAIDIAKQIGANAENVENITMLENYYLSLTYEEMFSINFNNVVSAGFTPCIEKYLINIEIIIEKDTLEILKSEEYNKVPMLTGYANGEGLLFYINRDSWLQEMDENFRDYFPPHYYLNSVQEEHEVVDLIKDMYFRDGFKSVNISQNFVDYFSDSVMVYWGLLSARLHANNSKYPVYLYAFSYAGALDLYNVPHLGAGHCAQTMYVLDNESLNITLNDEDVFIKARMAKMWSNFIKYGEPVPTKTDLLPVTWKKLDPEIMNFIWIDIEMEEAEWYRQEFMEFWNEIWERKWNNANSNNNLL